MTQKVLIADNSPLDQERLSSSLAEAGLDFELCNSAAELAQRLENKQLDWAAIILLLDLPGTPFALELLGRWRRLLPGVPLIVVTDSLDASLAARAHKLGANDVLQTPLDPLRIKSCFAKLFKDQDSYRPMIEELNKTIRGKSPALLATLRQIAKVIQHRAKRILLIGESGTGKELLAKALHDFSPNPRAPFIAVNVATLPKELSESELFGHEKGAFTGATSMHRGYMEAAATGTLFLDELGELDLSLQAKLLRAIQEKKFRRLKGTVELDFKARLVCATNRDLAADVEAGTFRRDLFHRVAEFTIQVPPLRERAGDIDELLNYFLKIHSSDRPVQLERETLTVLHSYPFPGNIRELENFVKMALIECDGDSILPHHLPLPTMGAFLKDKENEPVDKDKEPEMTTSPAISDHEKASQMTADALASDTEKSVQTLADSSIADADGVAFPEKYQELFRELMHLLPENWEEQPYKQMAAEYQRAFDRVYLQRLIERHHYRINKATKAAKIDKNTFTRHWKEAGLPPVHGEATEKSEEIATISDD